MKIFGRTYPEGIIVDDDKGLNCAFDLDFLIKGATGVASLFMAPVYLVGSALVSDDPLDIDIVIVFTNRQYWNSFGTTEDGMNQLYAEDIYYGPYERMARLVKKQKAFMEGFTCSKSVDFKIQTEETFNKNTALRVRIDQLQNLF